MFPGSALLGAWRTDSLVLLDTRRNSSKKNSNVVGDQPEEREREREDENVSERDKPYPYERKQNQVNNHSWMISCCN